MKVVLVLLLATASPLAAQDSTSTMGAASGRYATDVRLGENTCGNVTVQPLPTVVTHRMGDSAFTLVHGPLTHNGVLHNDGSFLTAPLVIGKAPAPIYTVQIAGRFTTAGFIASVSVDESGPRKCGYIVHWTGKRQATR